MPTHRFLRCLVPLLLAWLGGVPNAHAAGAATERVVADHPLSSATAARAASAGTGPLVVQAEPRPPAGAGQGRILFVLASSKVHGASTLPASISFGEVVHAWDQFHAAGYAVDFVSPDGGALPMLDAYIGQEVADRLQDERIMRGLRDTAQPSQIDPARYRAVYYVGGSNAIYGVPEHPALQRIAMHVYERNGGVVSAVCHGTAGLVNLKLADGRYLIAGKRITGYPEEDEDLSAAYFREFPFLIRQTAESRGASFPVRGRDQSHVQVDGRVVTGQNYLSAGDVAAAVIDVLRELAERPRGAAANG